MNIITPGSKVNIESDIIGTVLQVSISNNDMIQYQVSWWNGRVRQCEWLNEYEVDIDEGTTTKIGFK